jgi:dihydroorotate dehydrogenase
MSALRIILLLPFGRQLIKKCFAVSSPELGRDVLGLHFPNPLGIAAGFDKNGTAIDALSALGFGFIEIGSVTPRPQSGNAKPRLFRLKRSHALINRMGFNNDGCEKVAQRLSRYRNRNFVLGANIGKNKDTPNENALDDYLICFRALHDHVDYFVINVSSPNTPGLRALQEREPLTLILNALIAYNKAQSKRKPILLKIAPDLSDAQLDDIAAMSAEVMLDGLIISNTTLARTGLQEENHVVEKLGAGGLSGKPLQARAADVLKYLRRRLPQEMVIIGVGGIDSAASAIARMHDGATLIQIYTGLIFQGPALIRRILKAILLKA